MLIEQSQSEMPRSIVYRYCPTCAAYIQDRGNDDGRCPRCGGQSYHFGLASNPTRKLSLTEVALLVRCRGSFWGVNGDRLRAGWYGSN